MRSVYPDTPEITYNLVGDDDEVRSYTGKKFNKKGALVDMPRVFIIWKQRRWYS